MSTRLHVWGEGAPATDLLLHGQPSAEAFRAALSGDSRGRSWDPRENSSWAVTVELTSIQIDGLPHDPAVYGWIPVDSSRSV